MSPSTSLGFGIIAGLFCIICSAYDFDWFFNSNKAKLFVDLFGRNGARIFYVCLGLFLIVLGTVMLLR